MSKLERIGAILSESQFYFSKPNDLDDPFECRPKNIVLKKFKRVTHASTKWEKASRAGMLKGLDDISENRARSLSRLGICCFSEAINDTLMWSHYAESHKGIAIEFDATNPYFKNLLQITYQNEREEIGIKSWKMPEIIKKVVLVKNTDWKNQKEWRLINGKGGQLVEFPKSAISSIVFGSKCSKETISSVQDMAKSLNINYLKTNLSKHSYNINIEAYNV